MKSQSQQIAISVWGQFLAPLFDASRSIWLTSPDAGQTGRQALPLPFGDATRNLNYLAGIGVEVLLCGAISEDATAHAAQCGIDVVGFVSGRADCVLAAYAAGDEQALAEFRMPGCFRPRGACWAKGLRRRRMRRCGTQTETEADNA